MIKIQYFLLIGLFSFLLFSCSEDEETIIDQPDQNIVEIAMANGFTSLATALEKAGLVDALQGNTKYTVFAPTNEAFAALPESTLTTLLKPENKDQLISILTYHVVAGKVMAADVVKLKNILDYVTNAHKKQGTPISSSIANTAASRCTRQRRSCSPPEGSVGRS